MLYISTTQPHVFKEQHGSKGNLLCIICAAVKVSYNDEEIIIPCIRHKDFVYGKIIDLIDQKEEAEVIEDGFLTSESKFVSRLEAWDIAMASGQILRRVPRDGSKDKGLFSENIY